MLRNCVSCFQAFEPGPLAPALCDNCIRQMFTETKNENLRIDSIYSKDPHGTEKGEIMWPSGNPDNLPFKVGDKINHPSHYNMGSIECIDYIEAHQMDFNQGSAIKHLTRYKYKGDALESLKKAKWYVERLIAEEEKKLEKPGRAN